MAGKLLVYSAEARKLLKEGIDTLSSVVKITLGPKGRNVALGKKYSAPTITHDGVSVANQLFPKGRVVAGPRDALRWSCRRWSIAGVCP